MRGGAQSHLMLADDGHAYVVKFKNNPQHTRVLANEFLVSKLAKAAGLTVPDVAVIDVSQTLIDETPDLAMELGNGKLEKCQPGLQFASSLQVGSCQVLQRTSSQKRKCRESQISLSSPAFWL
jgi:hypothetical protein